VTGVEPPRPYASALDRRAQILELVERRGHCSVMELSRTFAVSDMTVRRDIQRLVGDGRLRGVHGGVTALSRNAVGGTEFGVRASRARAAKRAIARRALDFLPESGAIAVDSGTTTLELANAIPLDSRVHVVTPSLAIVNALLGHEKLDVKSLGGTLHRKTLSFAGPATVAAIGELRVRTLFLAASGLTTDGIYCGNDHDAVTKRALMRVADEVILLVDSGKFSVSALVRSGSWEDIDRVVTDEGIPDIHLRSLAQRNIEVVLASSPGQTTAEEESTCSQA
jgi:DeoR family transcriptional regulator, aga operon transcriptional repressor